MSPFNALETLLCHRAPRTEFLVAKVLCAFELHLGFILLLISGTCSPSTGGTEMSVETTGIRMFPKRIKAPKTSRFSGTVPSDDRGAD